jgi:hypothetical protein
MVKVVANTRGYIDGEIRETGEVFTISDALWQDEKRRPKWLDAAETQKVTGQNVTGQKAQSTATKPATRQKTVAASTPAPVQPDFKAKAEQPEGNGVAEALGGPPPDWLPTQGDGA